MNYNAIRTLQHSSLSPETRLWITKWQCQSSFKWSLIKRKDERIGSFLYISSCPRSSETTIHHPQNQKQVPYTNWLQTHLGLGELNPMKFLVPRRCEDLGGLTKNLDRKHQLQNQSKVSQKLTTNSSYTLRNPLNLLMVPRCGHLGRPTKDLRTQGTIKPMQVSHRNWLETHLRLYELNSVRFLRPRRREGLGRFTKNLTNYLPLYQCTCLKKIHGQQTHLAVYATT